MKIAAVILAGGKAARLDGIAKGLLPGHENVPLIARLIREAARAGIAEVILSANDPGPYTRFGKTIVADVHPGAGPLGGIEAGLLHLEGRCQSVLVMPCDLPDLGAEEIGELVRAYAAAPDRIAFARSAERDHPLCAVVPVAALAEISAAIAAGRYGVGRLWHELNAQCVLIASAARLLNINTPDDLRRWQDGANNQDA